MPEQLNDAPETTYPAAEWWDFECDTVCFPAIVDGERVVCRITVEKLIMLFGGRPNDGNWALEKFRANRETIQNLATRCIRIGRIKDGNYRYEVSRSFM